MASHDPTAEALVPRAKPRRTVVVLGAAVVSGIAGYLVLVLTARHLDAAENADFLVFWAALFSVFGVLVGIASETTRAVFAGESEGTPSDGVRVVPVVAAIGAATAVVLGVSGLWWGSHLFGDRWTDLLPVLLVGVVLFAVHCGLGGALAGRSEWDRYAALVAAESTVRVLAVAVVAVVGASVVGFAVASALAAGTWLIFVLVSTRSGGRCLPGPTSAWARTWPASSAPARRRPPPRCCWWASPCCCGPPPRTRSSPRRRR